MTRRRSEFVLAAVLTFFSASRTFGDAIRAEMPSPDPTGPGAGARPDPRVVGANLAGLGDADPSSLARMLAEKAVGSIFHPDGIAPSLSGTLSPIPLGSETVVMADPKLLEPAPWSPHPEIGSNRLPSRNSHIPEPASLTLVAAGLIGLVARSRLRKRIHPKAEASPALADVLEF